MLLACLLVMGIMLYFDKETMPIVFLYSVYVTGNSVAKYSHKNIDKENKDAVQQ